MKNLDIITLKELKLQQEDLFDGTTQEEIGNLLGVQAFLYVWFIVAENPKDIDHWSATGQLILMSRNEVIASCA